MQHRVNRWLSPELIPDPEAVQLGRVTFRSFEEPDTDPVDFAAPPPGLKPYDTRGRRRTWQRIAALVLLAGSAAFSYVAWSHGQVTRFASLSSERLPPQVDQSAGTVAPMIPSDDERLQALRRDQVILLRQENQLLRERVTALQTAVHAAEEG